MVLWLTRVLHLAVAGLKSRWNLLLEILALQHQWLGMSRSSMGTVVLEHFAPKRVLCSPGLLRRRLETDPRLASTREALRTTRLKQWLPSQRFSPGSASSRRRMLSAGFGRQASSDGLLLWFRPSCPISISAHDGARLV